MKSSESTHGSVDNEIQVQLEHCRPRDADAVVSVLQDHYQADIPTTGPGTGPGATSEGAGVWSFVLHPCSGGPKPRRPMELTDPVDVDLTGPADGVRHVRELFSSVFTVDERGDIPGEHEVDLRLRLS